MEKRQLQIYLTIVEEGSISRAAERLHLAQPYLSQQLRLLEQETGVVLIERTTRKSRVTDAGKRFAYRSRQILELSDIALTEMRNYDEGTSGTLRLGCVTSAFEPVLMEKLIDFHKRYEHINFEIHHNSTEETLELLRRGIIDIALVRSPVDIGDFSSINLRAEDMVAMLPEPWRNQHTDNRIKLTELAEIPLLLHLKYKAEILNIFRQHTLSPRVICEIEDTRPMLALAEKGFGAAILPRDWTTQENWKGLRRCAVGELSFQSHISVTWAKDQHLSRVTSTFLDYFRSETQSSSN